MKKLIIYGTGGHAELVYAYFTKDSDYTIVAFTLEKAFLKETHHFDLPILPFEDVENLIPPTEADMFIAVGPYKQNFVLENYCKQAKIKGYKLASYCPSIFKTQFFPPSYGENCFFDHYAKFHAYVHIGDGVTILGSDIPHHVQIGNYSFLSAVTLGGGVIIEDNVFIGMGTVVKQRLRIGKGSFIGIGCVILKDVAPKSVYSVPATKAREGLDASRLFKF